MRLANVNSRLTLVSSTIKSIVDGGRVAGFDVERASGGRFGPDPQGVYAAWDAFTAWHQNAELENGRITLAADDLGPVVPHPAQVFAIGLNTAEHAASRTWPCRRCLPPSPSSPPAWPDRRPRSSCPGEASTGRSNWWWSSDGRPPGCRGDRLGPRGRRHGRPRISRNERCRGAVRLRSSAWPSPFPTSGPWAPLVTVDELADPDDLAITCSVNGELMQSARTSSMVFDVSDLLVHLRRC